MKYFVLLSLSITLFGCKMLPRDRGEVLRDFENEHTCRHDLVLFVTYDDIYIIRSQKELDSLGKRNYCQVKGNIDFSKESLILRPFIMLPGTKFTSQVKIIPSEKKYELRIYEKRKRKLPNSSNYDHGLVAVVVPLIPANFTVEFKTFVY